MKALYQCDVFLGFTFIDFPQSLKIPHSMQIILLLRLRHSTVIVLVVTQTQKISIPLYNKVKNVYCLQ